MNKKVAYSLVIIVVLAVIVCISLLAIELNKVEPSPGERALTLLNVIKPEIDAYCNQLESSKNNSACPTCYFEVSNLSYYTKVSDFSTEQTPEYILTKVENNYILNLQLPLTYGWNTRTGKTLANFTISEEGNIISKNILWKDCL